MVERLDDQLLARVERVVRLTPTIIEVIVRAPAAARHFHPGQFYRLQNFERFSPPVRPEGPVSSAVLLAGGGLGNAVLFSIAKALKANGNRVIYFAGYKNGADLFKREEIESSTDQVIWAHDMGATIWARPPQD